MTDATWQTDTMTHVPKTDSAHPDAGRDHVWVNVASSVYVLPDFINLDNSLFLRMTPLYPLVRLFLRNDHREWLEKYREAKKRATLVIHDCRKPLRFAGATVDHILCSHFLEHVYPAEVRTILLDFHRVLRPGGTLHIIVPDLRRIIDRYLERDDSTDAADELIRETLLSAETRQSFRFRLLEVLGGFGLKHYWMYDESSITARIADAGFDVFGCNETPSAEYKLDDPESLHVVARKP